MKTVALVDFHTEGHHFAFMRLFAKYLLKNGNRVCIVYPENGNEIKNYLIDQGGDPDDIFFFNASLKKKEVSNWGRFNSAYSTLRLWRDTKRIIDQSEKENGIVIDLVFFAWLDDYLVNDLPHQLVDLVFPFRWSGLYFHPWYLYQTTTDKVSFSSIDSVLKAKKCLSVAVHDEFIMDQLKDRIKKPVFLFPEIADTTPPDHHYDLPIKIKASAKGRLIVGLIGLEKRKGVLFMKDLFEHAASDKYFFFIAGKLSPSTYSAEEFETLRFFLDTPRENLYYYPGYLEEGGKINAVIRSFDIVFLVYHNFKSSSNFNTKAAYFKRRVLATNQFWIGGVTQKYNLGVTVKEGDLSEMLQGLDQLADDIQKEQNLPFYDEYLLVHGEQNLLQSFNEVCR